MVAVVICFCFRFGKGNRPQFFICQFQGKDEIRGSKVNKSFPNSILHSSVYTRVEILFEFNLTLETCRCFIFLIFLIRLQCKSFKQGTEVPKQHSVLKFRLKEQKCLNLSLNSNFNPFNFPIFYCCFYI